MTAKTRDDRLNEGNHDGKGIANDRYSKSASATPQISSPKDKGASHDEKPHDTRDAQSSAATKGEAHSGTPDGHSDAARKSKT